MAKSARRSAPAGETIAERLAKLGLKRPIDRVLHLPLRYEDESQITPIVATQPGTFAQIQGMVVDAQVVFRPKRQLLVRIRDDEGEIKLRFIHFYGSQVKHFALGHLIRARGEVRDGPLGREIIHPRYAVVEPDTPLPEGLTPVYPSTEGLSQPALRAAIKRALAEVALDETLPTAVLERYRLMPLVAAVRFLHDPPLAVGTPAPDHPAWTRVKFDELLAQQLSLRLARAARRERSAPLLKAGPQVRGLMKLLPFHLTGAQERVWREIQADLAQPFPMQRLLQGDVGSGKTVVAALAALAAIDSGRQAALMAPTEILAEQHFRKVGEWFEALGIRTGWLTGSQKRDERDPVLSGLADGTLPLVIGTHALIQDEVSFARLGLVVIDEQHRFGVNQRLALRSKTQRGQPHQLMMSATPIPRTLAMTYYADLEVSTLDELPPGRQPIVTKVFGGTRREEVIGRVGEALAAGGQAYWVCPLVEESEALALRDAVATQVELEAALPGVRVGLLHGRMAAAEKAEVMAAFTRGHIQLLVATTVIEVGVDVPNASLMVIEHAERFGLAQLHQLRGRVGRGSAASVCILLYEGPLGGTARERLAVMRQTQDGFEIARRDLELRGPGEFLGQRQSGMALLRYADLAVDTDLIEAARDAAALLLRDHPDLARAHLERWLGGREQFLKV